MKLTAQSIVKLVKACKENGVTELAFDDFYLSFKPPTIEAPKPVEPATIPDTNSQKSIEDFEFRAELEAIEDDEAMMLIESPEEFESRIASGDMVDEEKLHD